MRIKSFMNKSISAFLKFSVSMSLISVCHVYGSSCGNGPQFSSRPFNNTTQKYLSQLINENQTPGTPFYNLYLCRIDSSGYIGENLNGGQKCILFNNQGTATVINSRQYNWTTLNACVNACMGGNWYGFTNGKWNAFTTVSQCRPYCVHQSVLQQCRV